MAEEARDRAATPPAKGGGSGMSKKSVGGLPQWAVIVGGTVLVVGGYLLWRKHQLAAANAATNASSSAPTYAGGLGPQYGPGLANDQASALYSQLLNLQSQVGNLTPQADTDTTTPTPPPPPTPTPPSNPATTNQVRYIHWIGNPALLSSTKMSLNELANEANTTPQAIIDATHEAFSRAGINPTAGNLIETQYFNRGNWDAQLPGYIQLYIPVPMPQGQTGFYPGTDSSPIWWGPHRATTPT